MRLLVRAIRFSRRHSLGACAGLAAAFGVPAEGVWDASRTAAQTLLQPAPIVEPRRVLLAVVDDLGYEFLASASALGLTPSLDALRAGGRSYERAWAAPTCSPCRAAILTGQRAIRPGNGVGINVPDFANFAGPAGTWIGEGLVGVRTLRGKWHLGGASAWPDVTLRGYDAFSGSQSNLSSHYLWAKWTAGQGVVFPHAVFSTNDTSADALADVRANVEFVHVNWNAVHDPVYPAPPQNEPPGASYGGATGLVAQRREHLRHLDYRIGELFGEALARGYVGILISDNGEPHNGKGTLTERGVHVPLLVCGAGVVPGASGVLVNATDLWATVRYLRGAPDWNSQPDSRCFADDFLAGVAPMPRRRVSFAERFPTLGQWSAGDVNWERACRDVRWKAIVRPVAAPSEEFYDLRSDPHEQLNLLLQPGGLNAVQQDAWDRLRALLE